MSINTWSVGQRFVVALAVMFVCGSSAAMAQIFAFGADQGPAPVTVMGSYRLLGQASSRQGTFSEKPPDLWRAEVNPTLAIYGIPITASLLLSSEQQGLQQNINAFSVTLDPDAIRRIVQQRAYNALDGYLRSEAGSMLGDYENVRDSLERFHPEQLKQLDEMRQLERFRDYGQGDIDGYEDVLSEMGLMSDVEQVMVNLPTVGVGTVFPVFTPITLSGARISGAYAEWNPGGVFYIAGVGGTTQSPLLREDRYQLDTTVYRSVDNSDFGRQLYGGRIGFGKRDGAHVILTGLWSTDDASSLTLPDSGVALTPQKNYLSSLDFKVEPIKGIWTLQAEVAASMTVGDQNAPTFDAGGDVPEFLLDMIDSSASVYLDWALTGETTVNIPSTDTRLRGSVRRIGAGYNALGVPNLRTDYFRYDVRVDQRFWKRQLSVGAFVRRDRDNLIPIKKATSTLFSVGGTLGLNVRGWPYFRASYAPYVQESDSQDTLLQYRNRTVLWSVSGGYSYRIGSLSANTNLTYSQQDAETKQNLYDYSVSSISAMQSLTFTFPLTVGVGLGYIIQNSAQPPSTSIVTVDGNANYAVSTWFSTQAGLTLAFDDTFGTRTGYYLGVLAQLGDVADIDIRAERNLFTATSAVQPPPLGQGYSENLFRVTVSKVW